MSESTLPPPERSGSGAAERDGDSAATGLSQWTRWCESRHDFLTSRTGWLSLVSYQKLSEEKSPIEQIPAFVQLAGSGGGALLTAEGDAGVFVDDKRVDGTVLVERLGPDGTPVITCGRFSFEVFSLDGKDYELRVYDEASNQRKRFDRVLVYDYDPSMVIPARLLRTSGDREVPWEFTRPEDTGHAKRVPATIEVAYGGHSYELVPFRDGRALVITFADATTGEETYAPGRFLRVTPPDSPGELLLDFNRAFIPPCGFSNFYSCPLPPRENRFSVEIRAGERRVLWL
ncbi:MAG TPA: DUF1684 domain-containing protein [Acidimicrobiales bacterium]|nr:DUF1684 domain-containing protein [Acidimicrobiales bacterium]